MHHVASVEIHHRYVWGPSKRQGRRLDSRQQHDATKLNLSLINGMARIGSLDVWPQHNVLLVNRILEENAKTGLERVPLPISYPIKLPLARLRCSYGE